MINQIYRCNHSRHIVRIKAVFQRSRAECPLCSECGGNGVVNIPGGISVCPSCNGECYESPLQVMVHDLSARYSFLSDWNEFLRHHTLEQEQ